LAKAWSPDQIAGRLKREYPHQPARWVSTPTIYAWIKRSAPRWRRWLRQAYRKQYRPFKRPEEVRIEGRPAVINRRRRYGDWEGDTIVGKGHRNGLVTLVERKSGLARIDLLKNLTSMTTMHALSRCLANLPRSLRRSTTFDNGPEFTAYAKLMQWLGIVVYFAAPYRAWQRGTNENFNGLVRQFYPKGTDFKKVRRNDVKRIERLLNDRPRRRLDYRTPNEVIHKKLCRI
jgi:IS30 family transposase